MGVPVSDLSPLPHSPEPRQSEESAPKAMGKRNFSLTFKSQGAKCIVGSRSKCGERVYFKKKTDLGETMLFMFLKAFHKTSDRSEEEGRLAKKNVPEHCPGTCLQCAGVPNGVPLR